MVPNNNLNSKLSAFLLVVIAVILSPALLLAQKVEIRVDMPRGQRSIGVGDEFHITYQVHDISAAPEQPRNVPGAKLLYFDRTGQSSRFQSINGHTSQSVSYTYTATLRAQKEGSYTFGPVTVGGVKSNTVQFSIGKASASASQGSHSSAPSSSIQGGAQDSNTPKYIGKGDGHLFLKSSVSKTSAYEQEALVYTVKLYTTYSAIKFIGATSAPKFEGFVVEESDMKDTQFNYETYNGKTYATAVIARYIIFPQMAGSLKVLGNTYTVSVDQREYFDDPFWGSMSYSTPLQLNVTPNDLVVNVRPLPTPQPVDFSGGVGDFKIGVSVPSTKLKSNQAASVVYTVTGTGNIKYIKLPDLNSLYPKELEVYSPTTDVKTSVGASNVSGSVKFDYSFMPLETGDYSVPEVALVYFNPSTGKYERSVARGFKVTVDKGSASDKSQTRSRLAFNPEIMQINDKLSSSNTPWNHTFGYWVLFAIPVMALCSSFFAHRRYLADHADMASFRSRRAGKVARRRLKAARICMQRNESSDFYDEMLKALWGYIADRLKMPTSELTRENVRAEFEKRNSADENLDRLLKLVDECEFAKYAPGADTSENMHSLYESACDVIDSVENSLSQKEVNSKPERQSSPYDNYLGLILILLMSPLASFASVAEADSAYNQGKYEEAVKLYSKVADTEGVSAALYYNLGNAAYRAGDFGKSMLAYQRAYRLEPGNKEIRNNLLFLSNKVDDANRAELKGKRLSVAPDDHSFFKSIHVAVAENVASDAWALWGIICFVLATGCVGFYIFSQNVLLRKVGFFGGFSLLILSALFVAFSFMASAHMKSKDTAVIMEYKVSLFSQPDDDSKTSATPLTRGTVVSILESDSDGDGTPLWYKVRLNHDFVGWIPASAIEII